MTAPGGAGADRLALWGGVECTVNRVGDVYRDQTLMTGHQDRIDDLARFAALGIEKLRYPVLWERIAPDRPGDYDWRWTDARLAEIARLGMTPIVGLIHHGSGPRYTDLLDPEFPRLFAEFAGAVAERYSHVLDWTPVNEPLTTARFSALYGHWYPHACDARSFWLALFNQIDAVRLGMRAIRATIPAARLVQTEDLGQTYSEAALAPVADLYNARRWLTWDLLAGRVVPGHPMWPEIVAAGVADRAHAIAADPCPADVIGINHYVTSDRYLDRSPARGCLPESGFHDTEAARVLDPPSPGLSTLLDQAWARYATPLAMTECHLGCTRDEQMRWLDECWRTCLAAREAGIAVVALTSWALVGGVDWDSLITRDDGHYEPGAFEVHGGGVRPTALATMLARLHDGSGHAALDGAGWWRRPIRLHGQATMPAGRHPSGPVLIVGADGTLGQAFAGACAVRGLDHVLTGEREGVATIIDRDRPWAVIDAAGWLGQRDATLPQDCAARGVPCVSFSSDRVFDGGRGGAYTERDTPCPVDAHGARMLAAERECAGLDTSIVVRTSALFSPYDADNFVMRIEDALRAGELVEASDDHVVTPTYVPDLVNACLDLVIDGERGTWHLSSHEAMTWLALARRTAAAFALDDAPIRAPAALPPRNGALASMRGRMLPPFADAMARHVAVRGAA